MASQVDGDKSFLAGAAIEAFTFVKLTAANTVQNAGAGEGSSMIGVAQNKVASGEYVAVRLRGGGNTSKVVAADAVVVNTAIYCAASGRVDDASSGVTVGTSLDAAGAAADVIECLII